MFSLVYLAARAGPDTEPPKRVESSSDLRRACHAATETQILSIRRAIMSAGSNDSLATHEWRLTTYDHTALKDIG